MAEAIARLDAYDVIEAFSAGLTPLGYLAGMTKQILLMNGYSVEGLESKGISPEIWDQADIVINMSGLPREGAFREYSKVEDWEIKDPFGGHPGDYQQAFERIRLRVAELAEKCRGEHVSVRSGNRRAQPRLCLASPIFVNLNDANGGVAFDVSIDGFGLSCATALPGGPLHNMRIQFPGTQHWIEVSGHVAWKNDSDRKAGIRFEGLKQEESRQIRSWISEQLAVSNFQDQTVGIGEDRNKLPEFPIAPHSESAIPSPTTSFGVSLEEEKVSLFPPATAPTLPLPGQPASAPTTGTFFKKQLDKRGVPSSAKPARNRRFAAAVRPSWTAFAAVGVLVGLFILSMDWVKAWRDDSNETSASLTQQAEASSEAIQNATSPAVGAIAKTPDAREGNLDQRPSGVEPVISGDYDGIPNTSVKDLEPQALRVEHSTSVASSSAADPVVKKNELPAPGTKHLQVDARASVSNPPLNDPAQNVAGVERPASKRVFKITNSSVGSAVARRPAPTDTSRAAEGPISLAAMKLRPLHGRIMPATSRQLEPPMTPAVILASSSATADPKAMETLIAIAKQPAIPLRNTGAIAIFADPYPSLRLPDRGISKKQRQATSLQLGRLLSRVEPVYPEDAKDHGIQGTVKLHAIIGRQGSVKNLESVDGSPVLVAAAINAVRQWRYSETILAGQSVETEEDIAVTFRLSNPPPPAN
jgi:TonB family protein